MQRVTDCVVTLTLCWIAFVAHFIDVDAHVDVLVGNSSPRSVSFLSFSLYHLAPFQMYPLISRCINSIFVFVLSLFLTSALVSII